VTRVVGVPGSFFVRRFNGSAGSYNTLLKTFVTTIQNAEQVFISD
jgi:hypothetical protein